MKNKKNIIIIAVVVVAVLAAIIGAVVYFVKNGSSSAVDVYSMELLNSSGWFYDDEEISGTITSDYVQEVYADEDQTVKKVFVEEGDTVEVGDKLLKYDVEEQQLDVKLQKLQIQSMKLDIEDLEKELEALKNTKTVGAIDSSGSDLLSASANLSSLKGDITASLLRADADDDTGESGTTGTTEDSSGTTGTTEDSSGTTGTTEDSSGTTATTEDSSGTTATTEDNAGTTTTTEDTSGTTTTEDNTGTTTTSTLRTQIKNRKTSATSGSGTEDDPYKYDLAEDGTIRGAVIMNLINNGEYGIFREYAVKDDGSAGEKINRIKITPDTVFTESLSSFAWYTISDLNENLVTVDSIKIKPAKSTVKTGQSYTFTAKLKGKNKDLVTVTWKLKGNKSTSTTLKDGVLKVASGETAKTIKVIAYAGTEKAVLKLTVKQTSSSSSGTSSNSSSSSSSSSGSSYSSSYSSSSDDDEDDTTTYTASELKEAIADKEDELEEAKQELKEARINYKEAKKEVQAATIKATISGEVTLAYTADAMPTDSPAIIVRAEEGMYVKASVSELALDTVQVGGTITCTSYETGEEYEAVVTEISEYPESSDSSDYYDTSNPNSSYYPIVAYIEDADGLTKNETVTITYSSQSMGTVSDDDIYLQKAYIKSDDGGKFVYKQGDNGRLEKQYVQTGATVYGQYVEILSGITLEDYIAFPYGNNVQEGAKTEISEDEDNIIY